MGTLITIVIAAVLAVAFAAATKYSLKHHTSCAECAGGDPSCTLNKCGIKHEEYRQQSLENLWNNETAGK